MKHQLRQLLEQRNTDEISRLAAGRRRVLNMLVSLTYDPEPLVVWRAIEALGLAARRVARDDPDAIRNHLRRLLWLISEESGAQCWRSPEAMAEIVFREPEQFAEHGRIVVFLLQEMAEEDLDYFRPGILWGVGRLGLTVAQELEEVLPEVTTALGSADPQTRGMAVWCLGRGGRGDLLAERPALLDDEGSVDLYEDGLLGRLTVGDLTRRFRT